MSKDRPATTVDYEPAGELKIGQVGIANLRVRTLDADRLGQEMRDRVSRAPKLFERAAVIVDFGGLSSTPDADTAGNLLAALKSAGVLPVALAYGSSDNEKLAIALGLPLLSKFRSQYESAEGSDAQPSAASSAVPSRKTLAADSTRPAANAAPAESTASAKAARRASPVGEPGLMQATPVRSGQQVYADNRDLTVLTSVGAGAEVIADGSIHIYGALRGRALAGAQGNEKARIFCREFRAELVSVAGHYKVLEDIPKDLHGKPVQVWLEGEELKLAALDGS